MPRMIATSFGVGYLPKAPGTWGALLAVVLWLPLYLWCSDAATVFYVTFAAAVIYCVAGTWASSVAERYWGKDPVVACADETVGMWISPGGRFCSRLSFSGCSIYTSRSASGQWNACHAATE